MKRASAKGPGAGLRTVCYQTLRKTSPAQAREPAAHNKPSTISPDVSAGCADSTRIQRAQFLKQEWDAIGHLGLLGQIF